MHHSVTSFLTLLAAMLIYSVGCKEEKKCEDTIYDYMQTFADKCGVSNQTRGNKIDGYIANGHNIGPREFPFVAQGFNKDYIRCSGVLITDKHVLMDALCASRPILNFGPYSDLYQPLCGTPGHRAKQVFRHPDAKYKDDIVVVEFRKRRGYAPDFSHPACLPTKMTKIATTGPKSRCYQLGRGTKEQLKDGIMAAPRHVQKMRVEETPCDKNEFDDRYRCFKDPTGKGAICDGDSGGPTVCFDDEKQRWVAIGLAKHRPKDGCKLGGVFGSWRLDTEVVKSLLMQC